MNSFSALQKMNTDYPQVTKLLIEDVLAIGEVDALFCGAAASVATYSASYDAPAGINTIVVQDSSAAVILQAADIDHIRADYTYTSSYAFESSKLYDFTVVSGSVAVRI